MKTVTGDGLIKRPGKDPAGGREAEPRQKGLRCPGQTFGGAGVPGRGPLQPVHSQGRAFLSASHLGPMCSPVPLPGRRAGSEPECPDAPACPWPPGQPLPGHQEPGQRKPQPGLAKPGQKNWGALVREQGIAGAAEQEGLLEMSLCVYTWAPEAQRGDLLKPRRSTVRGSHSPGSLPWGSFFRKRGDHPPAAQCAPSAVGRAASSGGGRCRSAESSGARSLGAGGLAERVPPPRLPLSLPSLRTEESTVVGVLRGSSSTRGAGGNWRPLLLPQGPADPPGDPGRGGGGARGGGGGRVLGQEAPQQGSRGDNRATLLLVLLLPPLRAPPQEPVQPTPEPPAGQEPLVETDRSQGGPSRPRLPAGGPAPPAHPLFRGRSDWARRPDLQGSRLFPFCFHVMLRYNRGPRAPSVPRFQASEPGLQVSLSVRRRGLPPDLQAGYSPKSWTNLWIQSPAMSAVTGPGRPGGPGGRSRDAGRGSARAA